jgi:antitoxin YefM
MKRTGATNPLDCLNFMLYNKLYSLEKGETMDTITYSNARTRLAATMKKVCENHEPVIITRQKEESVVMLSLEDFRAIEETTYLLRVPKNAKRLLESIAELERGGGKARKLAE